MDTRAAGTFEVKLTPQPADDYFDATLLGRLTIDKTFKGDLEATSKGQMLSALTATKGSAGYVALERVTGTLGGHRGTFVLQHSGTVNQGQQHLELSVVPDSGTDELTGLSGRMAIVIENKQHFYEFVYRLETTSET